MTEATPAKAKPAPKRAASKQLIAALLVRGLIGIRHEVKDALFNLRMKNKHVCVLLPDTRETRGALIKCKDFITYGTITPETKKLLEEKRGKKGSDGKLKPFFRMHPPQGGFERKGIKKTFAEGGVLGDRGSKMDALIKRMI